MIVSVSRLFEKDILEIKDQKLAIRLQNLLNTFENSKSIREIPGLKKLEGYANYYRIRIGNYRLGIKVEDQKILLLRFMLRKDIYKYFP